ncbi:MAG: GNAT family N-acetyltransferase [Nitrospira sp.]|nr:GNAT family N-acetyltransferase [Nitrospira sp.]
MITLVPMSEVDFPSFEAEWISFYADANVRAGHWPASSAIALAQEEFRRQLTSGLSTPGHRIYHICEQQRRQKVGSVWFGEFQAEGVRTGFISSIYINPEHRRQGYAKAALALIEEQSMAQGLTSVELHVFCQNVAAQALYRSLGYNVTGFHMVKPLRCDGT